ncbi:helix-turn-helix transcriptional regulator [Pseudoflavitalea sp. G-6-1-2]|uniref:helix-turn-helix domain-containing protein n=1 Tax=Pseudoflavitalea sp. G-6-1-2 TaxID=2728841 RepID=UPI00146F0821|nr:helix-turn-helix transcriptional regulator [Pseudoflavitalea sp. G-6-1-2]NML20006.1 helix-turn-helix transcriptional regulator [Pseudoflavitalea sp. G-6-1-2]
MQWLPSEILRPYVKNYTLITIDVDLEDEVFYPSGYVDFVMNVSDGNATTLIDGRKRKLPGVEVLGHLTTWSRLSVSKGTSVLIARIYPHASSLFFISSMSELTNYATDAHGIFSKEINEFYGRLQDQSTIEKKIAVLEEFLISKLIRNEKLHKKTTLIAQVCGDIFSMGEAYSSKAISAAYGLSERYLEKLFTDHVGITPSAFFSVHRFNKSLGQILTSDRSLTSIAYESGYFDQSHFIREFRKFTGITPFEARASLLKNGEEFQQTVNIGF